MLFIVLSQQSHIRTMGSNYSRQSLTPFKHSFVTAQALLKAMSLDVDLEGMGVSLSSIKFSYATAAIEDLDIPAGMQMSATVTVLDMEAKTSFQLSSDSSDMGIKFEGETFEKVGLRRIGKLHELIFALKQLYTTHGSDNTISSSIPVFGPGWTVITLFGGLTSIPAKEPGKPLGTQRGCFLYNSV